MIPDSSARVPPDDRLASSGLIRSTGSLMAGRLVVAALSWAATVLIARQLGQEGFGEFTLVFSLLGMLSIVTDLGLGRVAVTGLARAGDHRAEFAGSYILLRVALGFVGYGSALLWVFAAGYPQRVIAATAVGGLVVLFATPSSAYDVAFQMRNRLPYLAAIGVVSQLAQVALTVAIVIHGGTLVWFAVPAVLNDLLALIWKGPAAHRLIPITYRIDFTVWKRLIVEAAPLTLGAAFATLYYRADSLMLASLDTFKSVGAYGVAYKFVDLVHFVPSALTVALMAPLSASWVRDREAFVAHLHDGVRVLAVSAAGALVTFWLFATPLATLFYGSEYSNSGGAVRLLVTAESIGFFSALATTALLAASRHRGYPVVTFIGLVLNVVVNALVIPRWSFEGAAAATLLTEITVAGLLLGLIIRTGIAKGGFVGWPFATQVAMAAGLMAGVGLVIGLVSPWFVAAAASGAAYLVAIHLLRLIGPDGLAGLVPERLR